MNTPTLLLWILTIVFFILTIVFFILSVKFYREKAQLHIKKEDLDKKRFQCEIEKEALEKELDQHRNKLPETLKGIFKDVAGDTVRDTHQELTQKADSQLKVSYEKFKQLTAPMGESLNKLAEKTQQLESNRRISDTKLEKDINNLLKHNTQVHQDTLRLKEILSHPQSRGQWGEQTLKNLVHLSGMSPHCDFTEQTTLETGKRPDLIIHLAGQRFIAVDSKAPMNDYLKAFETQDPQHKEQHLKSHTQALRKHIKDLSQKHYEKLSPSSTTPALVILFLPHEAGFINALERDPQLFNHATDTNIVLAGPTTFFALLKTAAHAWRETHLADNTRQALQTSQKIYASLHTFMEHFTRLGTSLKKTRTTYGNTLGSLESHLLPQARKIQKVASPDEALPQPPPIDAPTRTPRSSPSASELPTPPPDPPPSP